MRGWRPDENHLFLPIKMMPDSILYLNTLLYEMPAAYANVTGSQDYPNLLGTASFYEVPDGVLVLSAYTGLPTKKGPCSSKVLAYHIHDEGHYNPHSCPHPYHAGDMPPLFENNQTAFQVFLTNRFSIGEIIGKMVVIHENSDDFHTQPSGNAGEKIAQGVIKQIS